MLCIESHIKHCLWCIHHLKHHKGISQVCICVDESRTVCVDSGAVVMWFESQSRIAHMRWSPQRGKVNKASIHRHCHCSQKGKTAHTGYHAVHHTVISLALFLSSASFMWFLSISLALFLGMNIEHYDRPSLIWCSQLRWPNTLNMSTNLSTASTSHWLLWRRMGWEKTCWNAFKFQVSDKVMKVWKMLNFNIFSRFVIHLNSNILL